MAAKEKTQVLSTLRDKWAKDSMQKDGKLRFGLFSSPPAGVWGDGDYNFSKEKHLGADGRVATAPRQIYGGTCRSGKLNSSFITKTTYITVGDPYIDPASIERQYQLSRKKKFPHEAAFKPVDLSKSDPHKALFKHMPEFTHKPKNFRGPDGTQGKVICQPRNIVASVPKSGHLSTTVGHLFSKPPKHMKDEYDRKRELEYKERQEGRKKLQEQPFRSTDHGGRPFSSNKLTYGLDKPIPPPKKRTQTPPPRISEYPFKPSNPSKKGYNCTISKFPEYKSNPIKVAVRTRAETAQKREAFKPNNTALYERPTPSISLNRMNLKSELSSLSARLL